MLKPAMQGTVLVQVKKWVRFNLTSACGAVTLQVESFLAGAAVGAGCVHTLLVAASVALTTLIDICRQKQSRGRRRGSV